MIALTKIGSGQNLIPNGDFESGELPCDNPNTSDADILDNWYNSYGGLKYVRLECNPNNTEESSKSNSGFGHITIGGSVRVNGVISSTFIGNNILTTLEEGAVYYLSLYGRSRGITHPD